VSEPRQTFIAGLGNLLLRDDGIGVHAAAALAADPPSTIEVLDIGTAVLHALSLFGNGAHILAVDAMQAGGVPGSMYLMSGMDSDAPTGGSVHAMGLCAALRTLSDGERMDEVIVLGVEPAEIGYGTELSPVLQAALPRVVETARSIAEAWRQCGRPADRFLKQCHGRCATQGNAKEWRREA
jgi:hydrogenase maturation protease